MKIFLDANIYLNYFRRSDASLSSLKALQRLLRQRKLKLLLPAQTRDEYFRNRNGIAEQSRNLFLRETDLKLTFPAPFVGGWPEALSVKRHVEATKKAYQRLLKKYDATVGGEKTPADNQIKQLFGLADLLKDDEDLVRRAYFRYLRGHPPRKNDGSFGDAIAWELLLASADDDLIIITRDGDFSERRKGILSLNGYLEREWRTRHPHKKIEIYDSLGEFINSFEKRQAVKKEVVQDEKSVLINTALNFPMGSGTTALFGTSPNAILAGPNTVSYLTTNANALISSPATVSFAAINANPFQTTPNTVSYLVTGATPMFVTPGGIATPYASGSPITAASPEQPTTRGNSRHCPSCNRDLTAELSALPELTKGDAANRRFTCPHCGTNFDPTTVG